MRYHRQFSTTAWGGEEMKLKLIITLMVIGLFLATSFVTALPISIRQTTQTANKLSKNPIVQITSPTTNQNIISKSQYIINLGPNEEIAWMADYVTSKDQTAYLTVETGGKDLETEGGPLFGFFFRWAKFRAFNGEGSANYWYRIIAFLQFGLGGIASDITMWNGHSRRSGWYTWDHEHTSTSGEGTDVWRIDVTATWDDWTNSGQTEGIICWLTCDCWGYTDKDATYFDN